MNSSQEQPPASHHVMLFDLSIYGHHPSYIQYLIEYWEHHAVGSRLSIVVSQRFLVEHNDVVQFANRDPSHHIQFIAIAPQEEDALVSRANGIGRNWRNIQEWRLFCRYAKALQVDHALVMYLDTYQLAMALGFSPPCPTSGIYFRPTFHYPDLSGDRSSFKEKLQHLWERLLLHQVLHSPNFQNLFSLDPFVVKYINNIPAGTSIIHLPDPVRLTSPDKNLENQLTQLRQQLGINPDRTIFLMFGALTARKGIYRVLEAIPHIPKDLCQKICLLLVGEADKDNKERINSQLNQLRESYPVQIVCRHEFVPESDVQTYFSLSDIVLATYQRHVGMSGILIWAAATQKPVISSDYGLMGEIVRRYQLGLTLDSTQPKAIAAGLNSCLEISSDMLGNRQQMQQFAEQNIDEHFAETIFRYIF